MQPRVVQAGPLLAATATKVALVQTASTNGFLALNGAAGSGTANNICLSQSGTAATPLIINGTLAQTRYTVPSVVAAATTIALINPPSPITITSAGNDSSHNFTIVGTLAGSVPPITITETLTGANASIVASKNTYSSIISITPVSTTASTVTVGTQGFATLDAARQLLFTSAGNDSANTITVIGTDWAGDKITESFLGANTATTTSVMSYLTVTSIGVSTATGTTISVGTNGVAYSPWIFLDTFSQGSVACQVVVTGTANYSVQTSNDNPDSYANPVLASAVTWDTGPVGFATATASTSFSLTAAPQMLRILLNSEGNTVSSAVLTAIQHSAVPL
jgi:hypothetical protein